MLGGDSAERRNQSLLFDSHTLRDISFYEKICVFERKKKKKKKDKMEKMSIQKEGFILVSDGSSIVGWRREGT